MIDIEKTIQEYNDNANIAEYTAIVEIIDKAKHEQATTEGIIAAACINAYKVGYMRGAGDHLKPAAM